MTDLTGRTHGRPGTYTSGCRCAHCRDAWADYARPRQRAYRAKKKAEAADE